MKQNQRILVVDDEQDLLEILKFNLETEGYEVHTATSAEEAQTLDIASFDLLLLDVMMGGMSGFASLAESQPEDSQCAYHLPHRTRHGERHRDRIQPRCGRLYI